jgi:hypothetical protein
MLNFRADIINFLNCARSPNLKKKMVEVNYYQYLIKMIKKIMIKKGDTDVLR